MDIQYFLACVKNSEAIRIWPDTQNDYLKLTTIDVQTADLPEKYPLNLDEFNGKVIIISGIPNGEWIWSAKVEEVASSLMSQILCDDNLMKN